MCTAHAIDNCAHQIKRSCVPFLIREGRISWWAVLWNRQDFTALSDWWMSEPWTLHQSFRHWNCPRKCKFLWQWNWLSTERKKLSLGKRNWRYKKRRKEKGSSGFSSAPNTSETYRVRTHASWLHNFQYSHLLLLSWAGNRLECSHSYTLLRYISVFLKANVTKVLKANCPGEGGGWPRFESFSFKSVPMSGAFSIWFTLAWSSWLFFSPVCVTRARGTLLAMFTTSFSVISSLVSPSNASVPGEFRNFFS